MLLAAQRGIHFKICVVTLHGLVTQRDVMRTNFPAQRHASLASFPQRAHAPRRAEVLAMHRGAREFRKQSVALHNQFLSRSRPARQPKHCAPVALVHNPFAHKRIILTVIHHRQPEHLRILQSTPHEFMILNAAPVICQRDNARFFQRTDRRHFLARYPLAQRPSRMHTHARLRSYLFQKPRHSRGAVQGRRRVRHTNHSRKSTGRGSPRARGNGLLCGLPRLAKMHVQIHQTRCHNQPIAIDNLRLVRNLNPSVCDPAVYNEHVSNGVAMVCRIDHPPIFKPQRFRHNNFLFRPLHPLTRTCGVA